MNAAHKAETAAKSLLAQEEMFKRDRDVLTAYRWMRDNFIDQALERVRTPPPGGNQHVAVPAKFEYHLRQAAADAMGVYLWNRHKIVYDIDPDLWDALAQNAPDDVVPTWLFSHLPHPDPFIAFPRAFKLPLKNGSGQYQVVEGVFVAGAATDSVDGTETGRYQVTTMSAKCNGLLLLFAGHVFEADGTPHWVVPGHQDLIATRITMTPRDGGTLSELVETVLDRFQPEPTDPTMGGRYEEDVPKLAAATVAAVMYVCAKNAELFPLPAPPPRAKGGARPKSRVKVIQVGPRLGAQLRAYARSQARGSEGTTGRSVRPHIRRGHFHTYRVGPGRQEMELKYLTPFPVNFKGDAPEATVVSID